MSVNRVFEAVEFGYRPGLSGLEPKYTRDPRVLRDRVQAIVVAYETGLADPAHPQG